MAMGSHMVLGKVFHSGWSAALRAKIARKGLLALGCAFSIAAGLAPWGFCQAGISRPVSAFILVSSKSEPQAFAYKGSTIRSVTGIRTFFVTAAEPGRTHKYDDLFYHEGKPLGLERHKSLQVPANTEAVIQVLHKSKAPSRVELKAVTNVLMRLALELHVQRARLAFVEVPDESYGPILEELQSEGFAVSKLEEGLKVTSGIVFVLKSKQEQQVVAFQ